MRLFPNILLQILSFLLLSILPFSSPKYFNKSASEINFLKDYIKTNNYIGYTPLDNWVKADSISKSMSLCDTLNICIETQEGNFTWGLENYSDEKGFLCRALISGGFKYLHFFGDSFIRHTYIAMASILSGDYLKTPLNEGAPAECFNHLYDEKWCRQFVNFSSVGCGGSISLFYHSLRQLHPWCDDPTSTECRNESIVFWTEGNHAIRDTDYGSVNNADMYYSRRIKSNRFCSLASLPRGDDIHYNFL